MSSISLPGQLDQANIITRLLWRRPQWFRTSNNTYHILVESQIPACNGWEFPHIFLPSVVLFLKALVEFLGRCEDTVELFVFDAEARVGCFLAFEDVFFLYARAEL